MEELNEAVIRFEKVTGEYKVVEVAENCGEAIVDFDDEFDDLDEENDETEEDDNFDNDSDDEFEDITVINDDDVRVDFCGI